jgi:hypothetical protein
MRTLRPTYRKLRWRLEPLTLLVVALLLGAAALGAGCSQESNETTRKRIEEETRRDAHGRCLAHRALDNYMKQCEAIGGKMRVERRTYICEDENGWRNPPGMADGPFCVCSDRNEAGECQGEADCSKGVEDACRPLLSAEIRPFEGR